MTEDEADSLLSAWGRSNAYEYAKRGYASSLFRAESGGSLSPEEFEHMLEFGSLPVESSPYVWLDSDLDMCDRVVAATPPDHVRVLKGVYIFGWARARAHDRALSAWMRSFRALTG